MKKLLPFLSLAIITAACNTQVDKNAQPASTQATQQTVQPDTTGLASFNAWKSQNELAQVQPTQQAQTTVAQQPQKVKTIIKKVPVYTQAKTPAPVSSNTSKTETSPGAGDANSGSISNTSSGTAKAEKKTGWSKAAKDAVIGGVAGAAGGAIINKKNRVVGAVIGGVIGAAGGYGIGKTMDKKDGRIDYVLN